MGSLGSAVPTTFGPTHGQGIEQGAGKFALKQTQPGNTQPAANTEAELVQLCSVPGCAGDRRKACPRDLPQKCILDVLMWPSRLGVKAWVACKRSLHLSKSLFILSHTQESVGERE